MSRKIRFAKKKKSTRLALVTIAKNEAGCIARCLKSVKQYVDEMIVLDTGSTDETVSIAEREGAKVRRFEWIGDFSAARNAALDHSDADWNLVLDADEWIEGAPEHLSAKVLGRVPFIGHVLINNTVDVPSGQEVSIGWIPRILPRGVRYEGRIHEQPVSDLPHRKVPLRIGHDGYRQNKVIAKKGRNIELLQRALDEAPLNGYYLFQMGKEHELKREYADAVRYYAEALQYVPSDAPYRHSLVIRTIFSLKVIGKHELAMRLANMEKPNWEHSPDFHFVLGDLLFGYAMINGGLANREIIDIVELSWLRCLEIGDQSDLADSVRGRGSFIAAQALSELYDLLGDAEKASLYRTMSSEMQKPKP